MEISKLLENLKTRGFTPLYFEDVNEGVNKIMELIPLNATIGFGGSMTVKELELDQKLYDRGNTVYAHSLVPPEQAGQVYQLAATADYYISSANALTMQGQIINTDGNANRVSTLCFGPKKIIYVVGINKIVNDVTAGIDRIKNHAAPMNCVRLKRNTPCAKTGKCENCNSDDCICNVTTIMHHPTKRQEEVYVILFNKELGY